MVNTRSGKVDTSKPKSSEGTYSVRGVQMEPLPEASAYDMFQQGIDDEQRPLRSTIIPQTPPPIEVENRAASEKIKQLITRSSPSQRHNVSFEEPEASGSGVTQPQKAQEWIQSEVQPNKSVLALGEFMQDQIENLQFKHATLQERVESISSMQLLQVQTTHKLQSQVKEIREQNRQMSNALEQLSTLPDIMNGAYDNLRGKSRG